MSSHCSYYVHHRTIDLVLRTLFRDPPLYSIFLSPVNHLFDPVKSVVICRSDVHTLFLEEPRRFGPDRWSIFVGLLFGVNCDTPLVLTGHSCILLFFIIYQQQNVVPQNYMEFVIVY